MKTEVKKIHFYSLKMLIDVSMHEVKWK